MIKRVKVRSLVIALSFLIAVFLSCSLIVSALKVDEVYFKTCLNSDCTQSKSLFEIKQSPIYLRAYNAERVTLNGTLRFPDGSSKTLAFSSGGIAKISLPQFGRYSLELLVSDGSYFSTINGEFYVVDHISPVIDLTHYCGNGKIETVEECDDGNNVDYDGCSSTCKIENVCERRGVSIVNSLADGRIDDFRENRTNDEIFTLINNSKNGVYTLRNSQEWSCPSSIGGVACKEEISQEKVLSYISGSSLSCEGAEEGNFTLIDYTNIVNLYNSRSEKNAAWNSILKDASEEIGARRNTFQCSTGCNKQLDLGLTETKSFLLPWPGNSFQFKYEIKCLGNKNDNPWNVVSKVKEVRRCVLA